jgi:hypothetical protein
LICCVQLTDLRDTTRYHRLADGSALLADQPLVVVDLFFTSGEGLVQLRFLTTGKERLEVLDGNEGSTSIRVQDLDDGRDAKTVACRDRI